VNVAAAIDFNSAFPQPACAVMLEVHQWFRMPSGRIAEVQRFETVDGMATVVVRYLNDDGDLMRGSGEFTMSLSAFLKITKRVEVSRG